MKSLMRSVGLLWWGALTLLPAGTSAQAVPTAPVETTLPAAITRVLAAQRIDPRALSLWVGRTNRTEPLLAWRADTPVLSASLMKLLTSAAALERLGPTWQWTTTLVLERLPMAGVLDGSVYVVGGGDPRLTPERLMLVLQQLRQQMGVQQIRGDIVLDRSAFRVEARHPGDFDGEPGKPYNVQPDALLINQNSLMLTFTPVPALGVARVSMVPGLSGVELPATVPLASGPCGDWRGTLAADLGRADRLSFAGRFPAECGEKAWPVAHADPATYAARAIGSMWQLLGGQLQGRVRDGNLPAEVEARAGKDPALYSALPSPPLAEVLRDMNKHSNNTIARHVMLALAPQRPATVEAGREVARDVAVRQAGCAADEVVVDNGSGLSRQERLSASCLGRLLQWAWQRPWMPELIGSLPIAGVETTARRLTGATAQAHLKTGSLQNVSGIAGYIDQPDGTRTMLVAILNDHGSSSTDTRAVLDGVLRWSASLRTDTP
ncbi:D-alanyl-D-alanine carboxypeptidase/D-alanyl-D-alanine-endopeptidase (penicillin-binding protein 4) [Sphaerotilus hippei]|uniref:D-alanyl-D-alanine carboxypeptidase/D-alanyl-D-alanine-endopeptidase (Penicillin-binding protein 4) n=1 Tax=Sphaerotilus hippei TaxID=744406 RepID=A0A318GZW1_9BURK|nr:D-alanyl-D-alanine carboxypeptidase/D-alanyl-D-alanine-endopeptidase [Sphaerotilus hippei]PXW95875.1 D-alanyl-D-alanine carboxypeptidase/D-alanyl-D-alanine-endopeptidase (penicillin-binding protein 4) [Sphaerotilus hippei]